MPGEPLALSTTMPAAAAQAEYDAICGAMSATARGRWFLEEFARRNRSTDTTQVLDAIARMQAAVVSERVEQATREASQAARIELLEMARAIAQAQAAAVAAPGIMQPDAAAPRSPPISDAAERLRQIAWTMRALGVDVPASEQIAQIADSILSADALRHLGEQRAQKLGQALHHLEQRIERMLASHRSHANDAAAMPESPVAVGHAPEPQSTEAPPVAAAATDAAAHQPMAREAIATAAIAITAITNMAIAPDAQAAPATGVEAADAYAPDNAPPAAAALAEPTDAAGLDMADEATGADAAATTALDNDVRGFEREALEPDMIDEVPASVLQAVSDPAPAQADAPLPDAPPFDMPSPDMPPPEAAPVAAAPAEQPVLSIDAPAITDVAEAAPDVIAAQVDGDLDALGSGQDNGQDIAPASLAGIDEPADFLLEEPTAAAAAPPSAPEAPAIPEPLVASAEIDAALTAIETELFTAAPAPAKPPRPPLAPGPLAALMALTEEERVALFS